MPEEQEWEQRRRAWELELTSRLVRDLEGMTSSATADLDISAADLRSVLRFINKVIQIADEVFQDFYTVLVDIQYLNEDELTPRRITELQKSMALLTARSRYRDAEEICSRLHHMSEHYHDSIEPIVGHLQARSEWRSMFLLLNEYEGWLIELIESTAYRINSMLNSLTEATLTSVRSEAAGTASTMRENLKRLEGLRNTILGLSGRPGLMELTSYKDRHEATALTIREMTMGDRYEVGQAGAVGPGAHAEHMTFSQVWNQMADQVDLTALASELNTLRVALKGRSTDPGHDLAVGEIAAAEIAAKEHNGPRVLEHLKKAGQWALSVATEIGATIAASALKSAMGL